MRALSVQCQTMPAACPETGTRHRWSPEVWLRLLGCTWQRAKEKPEQGTFDLTVEMKEEVEMEEEVKTEEEEA